MANNNGNKILNFSSEREQSQACLNSAEREKNQEQNVLNAPPLRFPEFSGEWESVCLNDVATFVKERINSDKLSASNYISTENMKSDFSGIDIAASVPPKTNVVRFQQKDVLLSNIRPYLKKVWYADRDGGCSADVFVFRATYQVNPDYLHYVLANDRFISYAMAGAKGVKMPRGDREQMFKYRFSIPNTEEQLKISRLISLLDERISTQIGLINKLESLIIGLAKKLTSQGQAKTRLCDCLECHTSTLQESSVNDKGIYPVYGASGVVGYLDDYSVTEDAILIIKDGSGVGTTFYTNGNYSVIGTLNYLTAKDGFNLKYLYYCLKVFRFDQYKTGMAIPHIYFKDYGKARVYCPSYSEQSHISSQLSAIENKIAVETEIKDRYVRQREYLLKQMFV